MKKMLFCAAMSAIVLTGCSKSESIDTPKGAPMSFYSYVGKARLTKGTPLASFTEGTTAGLVAYKDIQKFDEPDAKITNVKMTSNGTSLEPESAIDWPAADGKLNFYGYAPYKIDNVLTFVAGSGTTAPSVAYVVPTVVANQVDVMVAEPQKDQNASSNSGAVALPFHHALTQVKFVAKTSADYSLASPAVIFKVKKVTVKDVLSKGALSLDYTTAPAWTMEADKANFEIGLAGGADVTVALDGTTKTALCAANGVLMMLPQTLGDNVKVELVFGKKIGTEAEVDVTKTFVLNKALVNSVKLTEWDANQIVTYVFSLSASEISFSGNIEGWETVNDVEADIK